MQSTRKGYSQQLFQPAAPSKNPFLQLIENVQALIASNPALAEKAKTLHASVLSANESQQEEVGEPLLGLRNRKNPQLNRRSTYSVTTDTEKHTAPSKKKEEEPGLMSFTKDMGKMLFGAATGPFGFLLSAAVCEALPAGLVVTSGQGSGQDLCSGMYWCIQSTLSNITDQSVLAQFTRDFGITDSGGSAFTEWALGMCFDQKKLNTLVETVLNAAPDWHANTSTSCAAVTTPWHSVGITGSATHLTQAACDQFKSALANAATSCQTAETTAKAAGIGLGITAAAIVGAVLVVGCCFGAYVLCDNHLSRSNRR